VNREIITTEDGSASILMPDWGETYHSIHGAIQEAQHVYIESGLRFLLTEQPKHLRVLEMGFGTGLNTWLTALEGMQHECHLHYTAVEAYPLEEQEWRALNYGNTSKEQKEWFEKIHQFPWEQENRLTSSFSLMKTQQRFENLTLEGTFDLIYFDAFGYQFQPELWSEAIFLKMKTLLRPEGVLVTYACKGIVNRILRNLEFNVQKLAGPPGKREMTRAILIKK